MRQRLLAEFLGTFFLVFTGCGAIIVNNLYGGALGHTGVALVFGLVVLAMIYSVGNISGAHLNPAVTLGFFFAGRLKESKMIALFIIVQFSGAVVASGLLALFFPTHATLGATLPTGGVAASFGMETILTFLLMFVILNVSTGHKEKGIMAGVAVGGTVTLAALFGGPVSGASMNPARSLGPALFSRNLDHIWIYLAAPVMGAFLASPFCRFVQGKNCCVEEE